MGEFNVSLPKRFHYETDTSEGKERELEDYLHKLDSALEEVLSRLFGRLTETVDGPTTGNLTKVDEDGQLIDSGVAYDNLALLTGNQTIAGVKTFSSFPVTPSSDPTTNYQVANKKYVDDSVVSLLWEVDGGDTEMKSADDMDMQNMQIKGMCIENRTNDTGCTQTGRIWFRTDV